MNYAVNITVFVALCSDSTNGRGHSSDFSVAVVTILPGHLHYASPEREFSEQAELSVYNVVDAPHWLH